MATLTAQDNASIAKTVFRLFNERKLDEATKYLAPDYTETNIATGEVFQGTDGYKKSAQRWIDAFPDAQADVHNQIATEDSVCTEFIGRGTHKGPLATPMGPIPATGKRAEVRFCEIARFKNGKVVESRVYFDVATMLAQLGINA